MSFSYRGVKPEKTTRRRQLETLLEELDEKDLIIIEATAKGINEAKQTKKA